MGKDGTEPYLRIVKTEQGLGDPVTGLPNKRRWGQKDLDKPLEQHDACPTCGGRSEHPRKRVDDWLFCGQPRAVGRVGTSVISGLLDFPEAANEDDPI